MRIDFHAGVVVKSAESDDDRVRLSAEARALRACAHPGVVGLVALDGGVDRPERLTLRRLIGLSLAETGPQPVGVVAGQGAAVLTTLADLHELGWVHRAVEARHVLLDEQGRPVLCGFGRAERPSTPSDLARLAALDVAAVAALLRDRLPPATDRRLHRLLGRAMGERGRRRPPSARHLAKRILDVEPDARLEPVARLERVAGAEPAARLEPVAAVPPAAVPPTEVPGVAGEQGEPVGGRRFDPEVDPRAMGSEPPRGSRWGRAPFGRGVGRRRSRAVIIGSATAATISLVALAIGPGASRPAGPQAAPTPDSTLALRTSSDRFLMADPYGPMVTVIGSWGCGARRPAGLDLRSGWVWTFPAWPAPGSSVRGQPVGHVAGAAGLAVQAIRNGCDALVVLGPGGRRRVFSAAPGPGGPGQAKR